jgi:hypothetical protein
LDVSQKKQLCVAIVRREGLYSSALSDWRLRRTIGGNIRQEVAKVGIVAHEILAAERHSWRISPSKREASSRNSFQARSTSAQSLLMLPMVIRIAYRSLILVCDRNASPLALTASSTASLSRSRYSSHACLRRASANSAFNVDGRKRKHTVLKGAGASALDIRVRIDSLH